MSSQERLARANVLRQDIAPYVVTPEDIEAAIEEGHVRVMTENVWPWH